MQYWLVKSEPDSYGWDVFTQDGKTAWTGVRNFAARNNLRAMRHGDRVLFYESVSGKTVRGIAEVSREAYPDPTAKEGDWSAVDLKCLEPLREPVSLAQIKGEPTLARMALLRLGRLSVTPVSPLEYRTILRLSKS